MEEWKDVEGTNGMIQVSNEGRVRSFLRGGPYVLKSQRDGKGYRRIRITLNREKKSYKVHRLVASAFIPNPYGLPQVNHIDGNKDNNSVSNLEWISNYDNSHHAIEHGLWGNVYAASQKHNNSIKRPVVATREGEVKHFDSVADAERYFGTRHIVDVIKGKRCQAKGWHFSYESEVVKL